MRIARKVCRLALICGLATSAAGADAGAPLDVSAWSYRKAVHPVRDGLQQLDLDLAVLSRAGPDFADLRLMHDGRQVPYVLDHRSFSTLSLKPEVTLLKDPKDPGLSRWLIRLPEPGLPIHRLTCIARTSLFQRELTLYEELRDERGDSYRRVVGRASWTRTSDRANDEFSLTVDGPLHDRTVILETHNGDNPAIELESFRAFYPRTRLLFKAKADDTLFLFYGNPRAAAPRYDLNLVAGELLAADKATATLGTEEQLGRGTGARLDQHDQRVVFWGILVLVVVVLLVIISRLLPKKEV
jgi:hypothetical protein